MRDLKIGKITSLVLFSIMSIFVLINFSYANTYSNNSIEIEVSPVRRSYDYGDSVGIDINITNKNRYAKLHYKIKEVYSGGGFIPLNLDDTEHTIDPFGTKELEVSLRDFFYREYEDRTIDTHITFNNDASSGISKNYNYISPNNNQVADSGISKNNSYYHRKHTYTIGGHAYELTEAEYDEYTRYRNEKVVGEKLGTTPFEKSEQEKLEAVKGQINATLLIIVVIVIISLALILFIWFIIKSKSKGGYNGMAPFMSLLIIISILISNIIFVRIKTYAADIYQENTKYNKSITTQVNYANFTCTFRVTMEYYFVNTIEPITDLELDTDSDTLPDYLEVLYLTDLNNEDTDGDGLPDGVEVYRTYTDPLRVDTDNNSVNDGYEDYDKDGLTNIEEKNHGTDYDNADTDFDNLSDYDEINGVKTKDGSQTYITDPLSEDTDGDGLRDDTELKLNLNPLNPSDANTKVSQEISTSSVLPKSLTIESPIPISFKGELVGDIDENIHVRLSNNNYYDQIEGLIGNPIIIDTTYDNNAGLKITFDLTKYKNIANRIAFCRIDNGRVTFVEHTYVSNNILYADCYSGEYCLIDSKKYLQDINLFIK